MSFKGTNYLLRNLVTFETLFCVNRPYLIKGRTRKLLCYTLFTISLIIVISCVINDYIILGLHISLTNIVVQIYNGIELISLAAAGARMKKIFEVQDRLDLKCGFDDDYMTNYKGMIRCALILNVISVVLNIAGTSYFGVELSVALIYIYATAVHEIEIDVIKLLIQGYNLRLSKFKNMTSSQGCRVYRHVLIATAQLGEDFSSRVSITKFVRYFIGFIGIQQQ